jgi:hypothetical protein
MAFETFTSCVGRLSKGFAVELLAFLSKHFVADTDVLLQGLRVELPATVFAGNTFRIAGSVLGQ